MSDLFVCDAQVHAPDAPSVVKSRGINQAPLLEEMDRAGVNRAVIIPLPPLDETADSNGPSLQMAREHPDRFGVMGVIDVTEPARGVDLLGGWMARPGMLGVRLSFARDPARAMLIAGQLDSLWSTAERNDVPIMVNAPGSISHFGAIAARHVELRLTIDHMGLTPFAIYRDFTEVLQPVLALARYPNVTIKLSALPGATDEAYPFPSLQLPIQQVFDAFGPKRVFWGSNLTLMTCSYRQCVTLFTEELAFLSSSDREWLMGRALREWLRWD